MFGTKKRIENIEEALDMVTDVYKGADSRKLDTIEAIIRKLADKMGYKVNFWDKEVEPKELPSLPPVRGISKE